EAGIRDFHVTGVQTCALPILKTDLFGDKNAIGERILINGVPFTVIGVMQGKVQNSSYGGRDSRIAFIPASTFQSMYSLRWMDNRSEERRGGKEGRSR